MGERSRDAAHALSAFGLDPIDPTLHECPDCLATFRKWPDECPSCGYILAELNPNDAPDDPPDRGRDGRDPDHACSDCGDRASDHDRGGCHVTSPILGRPDEIVDCGCTWDGYSAGCGHHAPASRNCAECYALTR